MKNFLILGTFIGAAICLQSNAFAQGPLRMRLQSCGNNCAQESQPWHGHHYYLQTGQPTALIVPPTVATQQNYSWGVSQNTMMPVYHQFGPSAIPSGGGMFYATPHWPSHTNQFGVYPVRSPW